MATTVLGSHQVPRAWHLIDAADRPLGRLASEVATLLRGKHKPAFHPSQDIGDYVVVVNGGQSGGQRPQTRAEDVLPALRSPG